MSYNLGMSETYERDSFLLAYLKWHYGRGLREFFGVTGNFLWFISHFFSFKLLLRTLFAPWKRMGEKYQGGLDFGALASSVIVNSLMRGFGLVSRILVLLLGLISYAAVAAFSGFILLIWIVAPLALLGSAVLSAAFFMG